ncbi:MAG: YtxH domain-containing protein [Ardenticatenaceae bacterium]|nr:YtxH domain-containing protein [Ardenticatenaceae bacterium]
MNKVFSFSAGAICGALVGGVLVLLFTPASGENLLQAANDRWQAALNEGRQAMEQRRRELESQFQQTSGVG